MKTRTVVVISSAVLIVGCVSGCVSVSAQENNRDMGAVGASVNATIEAQPTEPEVPQGVAKRITPLSSWSSQPRKQDERAAGWASPAPSANPAEPNIGNRSAFSSFQPGTRTHDAGQPVQPNALASYGSIGLPGKVATPKNAGAIWSGKNVLRSSTFLAPGALIPPNVAPSEIRILRGPFEGKRSQPADIFSQTSLLPRKGPKAKQRKPRPLNPADFGAAADPLKSAPDGKR